MSREVQRVRASVAHLATVLWLPAGLIVAWWIASTSSPTFAFPPLPQIVQALVDQWFFTKFWTDFWPSVVSVFQGLAIAAAVGIGLGVPIGSSRTADAAVRPFLDFMRGIPKVLLISPALVIIGIGPGLILFTIAFGCVWPILIGTIDGVKSVSSVLHDVRRSYRLRRSTWIFRIALPAAAPSTMAGLRTALAIAVVLLVPAQAVGATFGLGFQLRQASDLFRFPEVWAAVIMFAMLGYLLSLALSVVERFTLRWFYAQGEKS